MPSSNPLPSCSVELRFVQEDSFSARRKLVINIDNKTTHIEYFHKDQLFIACEPAIRKAVKHAVQLMQ